MHNAKKMFDYLFIIASVVVVMYVINEIDLRQAEVQNEQFIP